MTIDLGFAWLTLPSGREISIVDVPGHERFVKNMLAGVGGIDLALLVIAADESVMPQTREHLAILDLLEVSRGLVAITKKDLVDEEMLELVAMDTEEVLAGTVLEGAPVVVTSAVTREGLDDLLATVDRLLDETVPRRDIGKPRLPIDRIFSMKGFGTVVTGTLIDGKLSVGQEVEILPIGKRTHIRGLQTHRTKTETSHPGSRVAMNLSGIATDELQRGYVVTTPGWLKPSLSLDVRLRAVAELKRPIGHNKTIMFHSGAAETSGKVRLLDRERLDKGEIGWAQLILTQPVAVSPGDFFIIRSVAGTLGGGTIIETQARRHRRFQKDIIERLETKAKGSPEDILLSILEGDEPVERDALLLRCDLPSGEATEALRQLISEDRVILLGSEGPKALLFSASGWGRLRSESEKAAQRYHQQFPLRSGMPKEELRSRVQLSAQYFNAALLRLILDGVLVEEGAQVRVPSHETRVTQKQQTQIDSFLRSLSASPFSPPGDAIPESELLNMLIEQRRVVKLSDNIFFAASAYDEMVNRVREHLKANNKITVAEVRDMFKTSRKYALALMEHLDEQKVTRRVGDERVLR